MSSEEVVQQLDDRPGYRIVDFEEVGLPVYRVVSIVLTLQPKAFSPIEDFVLRAVNVGLNDPADVAAFLGIEPRIVEATASTLLQDDDILVDPKGFLRLTPKSERVLRGEELIRPREQSLVFWFDGLTRKPIRRDDFRLVEPRILKDRGVREIRPFPAKRPAPDEIEGEELLSSLKGHAPGQEPLTQILQVKSVEKAFLHYIPASALIYRSEATDDVQVGFVIDGRLSQTHEDAFAESDGPARLGITRAILKPEPMKDPSGLNLPIGPAAGKSAASRKRREQAISRFRQRSADVGGVSDTASTGDVQMVAVYEHPPLLREALATASKRLIIISPWITDAVVDGTFLGRLRALLDRGVEVHIGYGLGEDVGKTTRAIEELEKLARLRANLSFVRLGDTHAKILIKDSDWLVTTSFNWLSFKGDPKRTFREEWGTKVAIPRQVEEYSEKLLKRLGGTAKRK